MKISLFGKKKYTLEQKKVLNTLTDLTAQLHVARTLLNTTIDEALIDSYIYEIIALHKKYEYFLKEAKDLGLTYLGQSPERKIG
ncbi:MAG: DUF2508 family protein [Bacillota bacterium]